MALSHDRAVSAKRMRQLDEGCATPDHQVRYWHALREIRGSAPVAGQDPPEQRLQLGHGVRRWQSAAVEQRSVKSHVAGLLAALKARKAPLVAAALTSALVDAYQGDSDDQGDSSDRLAALTTGATDWAGAMLDILTTSAPGAPDELELASDASSTCQVAGESASTLDGIESDGGTTYQIETVDGCCDDCADDEGEHSIDEPSPLPHHPNDRCSITKGDQNDN